MGYKRITTMDISEIVRRSKQGQSISSISKTLGYDRKTIRKLLKIIPVDSEAGFSMIVKELTSPEKMGRPKEKQEILEPFTQEIKELVNSTTNKLKPKSAFEVICLRHDLTGKVSYSSFKRFIRKNRIIDSNLKYTCHIENEPGSQLQVDYYRAGLLNDPITGKRKNVYGFIGTLSYSRHKYIEFVYSQNQMSFVQSHINMFNFFRGLPVTIKLDNLKSGVIKPDLYDPKINRAYAEMAEHYGLFLDPCRVASPQDKGIVERDVQTGREEFRKMLAINPLMTISEANAGIKNWIVNVYGKRNHGTTQEEPYTVFKTVEQPLLLSLPLEEYIIAQWKEATVHPDHYLQVNMKYYSMPDEYIGKKLMVKLQNNIAKIYYNEELVKQHIIPVGNRSTDINDFPENMRHRLDTGMPFYLRQQANAITPEFEKLIMKILTPNAYINLRRAQAIVTMAKNYSSDIIKVASITAINSYPTVHPKLFKSIIEKHQELINESREDQLTLSIETESFVRDTNYFTHS